MSSYVKRTYSIKLYMKGKVDTVIATVVKNKTYKICCENGYYLFRLESLLEQIGKSRYTLAKELPSEYKVINRYAHGDLTRFDAQLVAKICDYCNCKMSDIIEYYPNQNK